MFDHCFRMEICTCFSHAADVKYRGKNSCHQQHMAWIGYVALMPRIPDMFQHRQELREKVPDGSDKAARKMELSQVFPGFFSCNSFCCFLDKDLPSLRDCEELFLVSALLSHNSV